MTIPADERSRTRSDHLARSDLAWAISLGGIGVVLFTALLAFTWYFAATLLLIFAGMLLGVGLNALTNALWTDIAGDISVTNNVGFKNDPTPATNTASHSQSCHRT